MNLHSTLGRKEQNSNNGNVGIKILGENKSYLLTMSNQQNTDK